MVLTKRPLTKQRMVHRRAFDGAASATRNNHVALAVFACVCCLIIGLVIGYFTIPSPVPQELRPAQLSTSMRVAQESFDDERTVKAEPNVTYGQKITWRGSGTVTAINVVSGGEIASGSAPFQVDGIPIIALYTAVPLYRDLSMGTQGQDVCALRDELSRIGYSVQPSSGDWSTFDWSLREAVRDLQISNGLTNDAADGEINLVRIVWIPQTAITFADSALVWGQDAPQDIGSSATVLSSLSVSLPTDLVRGARVVSVGGTETTLTDDGVVSDPVFLSSVQQSQIFLQWLVADESQRKGIDVTIRLRDPVEALKVPAGSVFSLRDDHTGCVQSEGKSEAVILYGSLNGYAMVVPQRNDLHSVDVGSAIKGRNCPAYSGDAEDM